MTDQTNPAADALHKMVREFQNKFDTPQDLAFWASLVEEETKELLDSFVSFTKELADLNYVLAGYVNVSIDQGKDSFDGKAGEVAYQAMMALDITEFWLNAGIPMPKILELVHTANMSKVDDDGNPVRHPDTGKVLKDGTNYQPPEPIIGQLLFSRSRADLEQMLQQRREAANQQETAKNV
jgi:predicted HAD superfamily Cof-like phosphohydrolase